MVRTVLVDDYLTTYLSNLADQNANAIGLILGQACSGKDYVIHFAKTPPFQSEDDRKSGKPVQNLTNLDEVNANWVADHARQTTRMLPGGMYILAEVKLLAKKWSTVECDFGFDKIKYLKKNETDWPLEKHIKVILSEIHDNLESAVFLYEGEFKDVNDSLENVGKKKSRITRSSKGGHDVTESSKPVKVLILTKCSRTSVPIDSDNVIETSGQLRMVGQISCKLWLLPKSSISEVSTALKQDIMRSLESRLEMHWDSLTEEENSEDVNCVHEPPRRVLITLPNSNITLSDYLFPGEGAQDAKVSLEELLDIKIKGKLEIQDIEGQADITEYCKSGLESDSMEILPKLNPEANKFMYIGLVVALIVLIFSLLLHFFK
ncbi:hypothetical protein JTB14_010437 [Gonioctena quinquepunctata]|nr:hypothetical protein JTB14_010437 [Gonioctena quinquepunctata]